MQTSKVVSMMAGVAALSSVALAGEVTGAAPVSASAGADFLAKGQDTVSVTFAGRTEFEYSDGDDQSEGFGFRRLRLGAHAQLGSGWNAETVVDFAGATADDFDASADKSVSIRKAIITKQLTDMFHLSVGRDKVVFGYEETSSSATGVFLERSLLGNIVTDNLGAGVQNNITLRGDFGSGFTGALSIADAQTSTTGISETEGDASFFGRVQWANDFLTVGADYADNNDGDAYTIYANYQQGGLNVLAEYFDASRDNTFSTDAITVAGGSATVPGASTADGFAVRASYRFGDWEPVVRYSDFDYSVASGAATGSADELYIGVNYYIAPQVTLLAGFTETNNQEGDFDDSQTMTARLRVLW